MPLHASTLSPRTCLHDCEGSAAGLQDLAYARGLPYTISLPLHGSVVVHAGLVPGRALAEQRPRDLVCMRNLQCSSGGWVAQVPCPPVPSYRPRNPGSLLKSDAARTVITLCCCAGEGSARGRLGLRLARPDALLLRPRRSPRHPGPSQLVLLP